MVMVYALCLLYGKQFIVEHIYYSQWECERAQSSYVRKSRCETSWAYPPQEGKK